MWSIYCVPKFCFHHSKEVLSHSLVRAEYLLPHLLWVMVALGLSTPSPSLLLWTPSLNHLEPHTTMDWFKFGKGVCQGCILSPCLFNFYVEYVMRNARLDEAQPGIKVAGRNNNNLRYADDTTLMAESEEELKNLLMKVKAESEKSWLKTQHS